MTALKLACIGLVIVSVAACSSGGKSGEPPCTTICSHLESSCGMPVAPDCASECATWSAEEQSCAASVTSCAAAAQCLNQPASDGSPSPSQDSSMVQQDAGQAGLPCDPWTQYTNTASQCAAGCLPVQSDDMMSFWCLKPCTTDNDCNGGDLPGSCQQTQLFGNPTACIPVCANDSQCSAEGWGSTCENLQSPAYCSGGPNFFIPTN